MNKMKYSKIMIFVLIVTVAFSLAGCSNELETQLTAAQQEVESLKEKTEQLEEEKAELTKAKETLTEEKATLEAKVEELSAELEEAKYGASKLLTQAKNLRTHQEFDQAKNVINLLLSRHNGTPEAEKARELLTAIDEDIARIAEEKRLAEQQRIEEEQRRLAAATGNMRQSHDEVQGITWYTDNNTPRYVDVNNLHIYIGQNEQDALWLRLKIQYTDEDWLFIDSYTIKTDNNVYTLEADYGDVERDNDNGYIWEWYDVALASSDLDMIRDIIQSERTILRYHGSQYHEDRTITEQEKQSLQNVLDAYRALGGSTTVF